MTIQIEHAPQDGRVSTKPPLPAAVTQNHQVWIAFRTRLVSRKRAAEDGLNAHQVEIVGSDELAIDGFGFISEPEVDQIFRICLVPSKCVEELTDFEVAKIRIRDLNRISSYHMHQMFGFARRRAID